MVAVLSPCFLPLAWVTPLAAQDNDSRHVRVQFSGGAAWSEMGSRDGASAPLPAGPARANYGLAANAQTAPLAPGAEPRDHLRLKPINPDGF